MNRRRFLGTGATAVAAPLISASAGHAATRRLTPAPKVVALPADLIPFSCPPIVDFALFKGNIGGNDFDRVVGLNPGELIRVNRFTSPTLNSDFEVLPPFRTRGFTSAHGPSFIGREVSDSTVKVKIEQPGYIVVNWWFQGATIQTGNECHLSGGAFEGQLVVYHSKYAGLCVSESWSIPEGFAISSNGKRINFGSLNGEQSLMFDKFCMWRIPTECRYNHIAFNEIKADLNGLEWHPFRIFQPGTTLDFNIGWVKITLPCE